MTGPPSGRQGKRRRPIPCPHVSEGDKRDTDRLGRGAPHRRAAHGGGSNDLGGAPDRDVAQPVHRILELSTCLAVGPLDGVPTGRGQAEGDEDRNKGTEEQKDAARGELRHVELEEATISQTSCEVGATHATCSRFALVSLWLRRRDSSCMRLRPG